MGATSRRFKVIASHPDLNAEVKPFVQKLRSIVKKKKIPVLSTGSMPPAIPEVECDLSGLVEAISLLRLEIIYIIDRCDFVSVGFVFDGVLHSSKLVSDSDGASAFRRAAGAWSARPRALPIHDCALADGPSVFEITGGDPQLLLCEENSSSAISLSSGVYEIVLQAESFPKSLRRPILYIDEGNGFSENRKNILAKTGDNIWRARFAVDRHAKALRLDPSEGARVRFSIVELALTFLTERIQDESPDRANLSQSLENSKVFCVNPFIQAMLTAQGSMKPCSLFTGHVTDGSQELSVYETPVEDIWNSEHLRRVRRQMIAGDKVSECSSCYLMESRGEISGRIAANQSWGAALWGNPRNQSVGELAESALAGEGAMRSGPSWLYLEFGNLCNLRCRSCNSRYSKSIAKDRVHRRWENTDEQPPFGLLGAEAADNSTEIRLRGSEVSSYSRLAPGKEWSQDREFILHELLRDAHNITKLQIGGGEPVLVPDTAWLLETIVSKGLSSSINLHFVTNGTKYDQKIADLIGCFDEFAIALSVDGFSLLNEYIRKGSRWRAVSDNVVKYCSAFPQSVYIKTTVQAYNMLHLVDLANYANSMGIRLQCHFLNNPRYLSCFQMPAKARQAAATKLRQYTSETLYPEVTSVSKENASELLKIAQVLEEAAGDLDPRTIADFINFTSDLDASRGQDILQLNAELVEFIGEAGVPWEPERP